MIERSGNLSGTERAVSGAIGLSLSVMALQRGSPWLRALAGVTGASLMARAAVGHCAVKAALNKVAENVGSADAVSGADNAVDEAANDSFPASDPPASRLPDR